MKTLACDEVAKAPTRTEIFHETERWARQQGAVRLDLHTWDFNQGAIALYRAMGMTVQRYVFEKKLDTGIGE